MTKSTAELEAEALATPLGRAFKRLFSDPAFVDAVINDPAAAAAEYGLDADEAETLRSDAYALEGEVAGFAMQPLSMDGLMGLTGGMRTPTRMGLPRNHSWVGCLTCI